MKTTKEDFEFFSKWFFHYAYEVLHLARWTIRTFHEASTELRKNQAQAWVITDIKERIARASLNTEWIHRKRYRTQEELKNDAFHEAGEILLSPLTDIALEYAPVNKKVDIKDACHEIINTLEAILIHEKEGK
jgi:hypothetical protein